MIFLLSRKITKITRVIVWDDKIKVFSFTVFCKWCILLSFKMCLNNTNPCSAYIIGLVSKLNETLPCTEVLCKLSHNNQMSGVIISWTVTYNLYRPTSALNGTCVQCFPHFHNRKHIENENICQHTEENGPACLQPEQLTWVPATLCPALPEGERTNISAPNETLCFNCLYPL